MIEIRETERFSRWLGELRDDQGRTRIQARILRLRSGNPGDTRPVGCGVLEMRIHFGPGYRVYFVRHGSTVVVLLGGGDKSTQKKDIDLAIAMAGMLEE